MRIKNSAHRTVRTALYARCSRADAASFGRELEALQVEARLRRWEIYREFIDIKEPGGRDLTARRELMSAAARGHFDVVCFSRLDRFATSVREVVCLVGALRADGVAFLSVEDGINTLGGEAATTWTAIVACARMEGSLLRERAQRATETARREGTRVGRPSAEVDLAMVLEKRAQGTPFRQIARETGLAIATLHRAVSGARQTKVRKA